jgi:DNA-binding transcriptional MerR regulator
MPALRIGDLSARSGFSRDAIRYYERIGLLGAPPRTDGGYRVYGEQALNRLRVIRNARSIGFSLAEIRGFMKVRDAGGVPCAEVRKAAETRLDEVTAELKHLEEVRRAMRRTLARWDEKLSSTPRGSRAGLLEGDVIVPERLVAQRRRTRPAR